jgi:gluconokinase
MKERVIIIMGVSGSGKSTIGQLLAQKIGAVFLDGDDFHPPSNIAGIPLDDDDRQGWLEALGREICSATQTTIIACSALKDSYRRILEGADFVFLKGSQQLLAQRLSQRTDHYMPASLLRSQLEALEEPSNALTLDIKKSPQILVEEIIAWM